jgi:hypothetical protein
VGATAVGCSTPLTGLVNRRRFFALLGETVDRCRCRDLPGVSLL